MGDAESGGRVQKGMWYTPWRVNIIHRSEFNSGISSPTQGERVRQQPRSSRGFHLFCTALSESEPTSLNELRRLGLRSIRGRRGTLLGTAILIFLPCWGCGQGAEGGSGQKRLCPFAAEESFGCPIQRNGLGCLLPTIICICDLFLREEIVTKEVNLLGNESRGHG